MYLEALWTTDVMKLHRTWWVKITECPPFPRFRTPISRLLRPLLAGRRRLPQGLEIWPDPSMVKAPSRQVGAILGSTRVHLRFKTILEDHHRGPLASYFLGFQGVKQSLRCPSNLDFAADRGAVQCVWRSTHAGRGEIYPSEGPHSSLHLFSLCPECMGPSYLI